MNNNVLAVMEDFDWMDMMEKMQDFRLFSSLHVKGKRKGAASSQEIDVLSRIMLSAVPLTPFDLSVQMGLSKSAVSRLIESLERKRFLSKQYNERDKRSYTLYITKEGNQELEQAYHHYLEPVYKLRYTIGEERFQALTTLIKEANEMLQNKEVDK